MKLVIAGGGTGGHLFPGIAVAEELLSRDPANQVLFVGTERGIEARAVPAAGYPLELISASGIRGKGSFNQLRSAAMMLYGYAQSRKILKKYRPDAVLGVGGYASLPLLLAAKGLQIPTYIHEQNAIPGMTNKVLAKVVDQVFITLQESARFFPEEKVLLTGNPLRRQILELPTDQKDGAKARGEGFCENLLFHLFIFGGSQGAHAINMAMIKAAPHLSEVREQFSITHQTGEKDFKEVEAAYREHGIKAEVTPFITDMAAQYRKADLIICRAGATTIAEVTACGKAAIFIPFPHAVDDHQRRNAEALLKKDACFMLLERDLNDENLAEIIRELMQNPEKIIMTGDNAATLARFDAAKIIVDRIMEVRGALK